MTHASDTSAARTASATPPAVGCPIWCDGNHVAWQPDADEFVTDHKSPELASPGASYSLSLYAVDWFYNGTMRIGPGNVVLRLEDDVVELQDAQLLAADLARTNAMAACSRRRVR